MAFMKETFPLCDAPGGNSIGDRAPEGASVNVLGHNHDPDGRPWKNVQVIESQGQPTGWVLAALVDESGQAPLVPIGKGDFARECWRKALLYGVNPHYMAAVAELRSGTQSGRLDSLSGPFRLSDQEWEANRGGGEFGLNFGPEDSGHWRNHCDVFAVMAVKALSGMSNPTASKLYTAQLRAADPPVTVPTPAQIKTMLLGPLQATKPFVIEAAGDVLADASALMHSSDGASAQVNFGRVPAGREDIARLILSEFAAAGYGRLQQIAALANAIAESGLNPNAHNTAGEDSVGLFQLNRNGGLGAGHAVAALKNPNTNIAIIIAEANRFPAFKNAVSIFAAVDVFVRKVERPADAAGAVIKRVEIAERLLAA